MNGVFQIVCVILQNLFIKILNAKCFQTNQPTGKIVILRLDLNVPLKNGEITDTKN